MSRQREYQVKEVARLSGVSVRTLHHYDAIGLLVPGRRSASSYRLYDDGDLLRLQQILIGRELGLPLEHIRRSLDDPGFDQRSALLEQRRLLEMKRAKTGAMIRAIDAALLELDENPRKENNMPHLFDGFEPARYERETEQRWGATDSHTEASRRTRRYTEADWKRFAEEQREVYSAAALALEAGNAAVSEVARAIAERHRRLIDRWFYPCDHVRHALLADLYENDARFAASIDGFAAGLTPFLVAAIRANCNTTADPHA